MFVTFVLIFGGALALWLDKKWSYWLMLGALVLGTAIFIGDVDFATPLGLQF